MQNAYTIPVQENLRIIIPLLLENPLTRKTQSVNALVDTGASVSCIRKDLAEKILALREIRKDNLQVPYGNAESKSFYNLNAVFPPNNYLQNILAAEFDGQECFDFVIGMNILLKGDFAVSSANGIKIFSICFPSANRPIDFRNI